MDRVKDSPPAAPSDALLPCPFCGGTEVSVAPSSMFGWVYAGCEGCGAQASEVRKQTLGGSTPEEWQAQAERDAIREWNTRAALAAHAPMDVWIAERDTLRKRVRVDNIRMAPGNPLRRRCLLCRQEWAIHGSEEHAPNCIAYIYQSAVTPPAPGQHAAGDLNGPSQEGAGGSAADPIHAPPDDLVRRDDKESE